MPPAKKHKEEPEKKTINDLSGGVDYDSPAGKLPENKFTDVLNLQYFRGLVRVDTGYAQYRQAVEGIPQTSFQFVQQNGSLQTLLLTTTTLYIDNGVEWQYVSDGTVQTFLGAPTAAGSNIFQLNNAAGIQLGDKLGITLDDTTQLRSTVTAIAVNQITFGLAVPVGRTAGAGAAVVRPPILNGSVLFQPVEVQWPELNSLIFTNGADPIQIWDGQACKVLPGWNNITARVIVAFHGFLIAFDTTEAGIRYPQRARQSDQNNPEDTTTGLSGFVDLTDTEDFILAAIGLGPWLIIYRQNNVMRRSYIGDPLQLFFDEYMLQGVGIWSQNSVADTGSTHVIIGPQGIFRYAGGYDVEDLGEPVFSQLYGPQGIANLQAVGMTTAFYVQELDEVWFMIATGANLDVLDSVYRLDQGRGSWWLRKFADGFVGFGFIEGIAGRSWQQASLTWSQDTTTWLSHSKTPSAPILLFCDPVAKATMLYDFISATDNGDAIPWSMTTKDFEAQTMFLRFDGVYIKGSGSDVLVEISFNRGESWIPLATLNFGLTPTIQQANSQYVAEVMRLRFSGKDPAASIDWYRVDLFPESEW